MLPLAVVWKVNVTGLVYVSTEYADESHPPPDVFIAEVVVVFALILLNVNESQRDTTYEVQYPLSFNHVFASAPLAND
jgi:hypothetical protein